MGRFLKDVEEIKKSVDTYKKAENRALEIFNRSKNSTVDKSIEKRNTFLERGKLYSFNYSPIEKDALGYYDKNPLVFVVDRKKTEDGKFLDIAINLNFLTFDAKVFLLDRIVQAYKLLIKGNSLLAPNRANTQTRLPINWDFAVRLLGPSARFAVRSYYTSRRSNTYCFSYETWKDLVFLDVKDIEGATLNEIYRRVRKP